MSGYHEFISKQLKDLANQGITHKEKMRIAQQL